MIYLLVLLSVLRAECVNEILPNPDQLLIVKDQAQALPGFVQSRFIGPVDVRVWQHWQPSYNVDNQTEKIDFELVRGEDITGRPYVLLRYRAAEPGLVAYVEGDVIERAGEWQLKQTSAKLGAVAARIKDGWSEFTFENAADFIDVNNVRAVSKIRFGIFRGDERVYEYALEPMFARGQYWQNPIAPYSAHAGSGQIAVATAFDAGLGWNQWNGTPIEPRIAYIEHNTLADGAEVGLHRHERNQEIFQVTSGLFVMVNGLASATGNVYEAERVWNDAGEKRRVKEFRARGGWLESRHLRPGEFAMIVPNPNQPSSVFFHGIRAVGAGSFTTMGAKN